MSLPTYEVYAIRYARHDRTRGDNFIVRDPLHDVPMPMDYFVWLVQSAASAFPGRYRFQRRRSARPQARVPALSH